MENKIRYIPSNGTEGQMFIDNYCERCIHEKWLHHQESDEGKCEILSNSLMNHQPCYDKDLKQDGWEWFCNKDYTGRVCNQFKHWDWDNNDGNEPPKPEPYDPNQLVLFSFDEKIDNLIQVQELQENIIKE
jgi:hypothetical protein